jgi:hypothetical protein
MNNLESINLTYEYLSYVYGLTKSDYIKRKMIKSEELKGLNPKSLIKYNFLTAYNDKYKWRGVIPQYFHAYNYYHEVRGNDKNYNDLLTISKNPENYDVNQIREALTIKSICDLRGLENNKEDNIIELIEKNALKPTDIPVQEKIIPDIPVQKESIPEVNILKSDISGELLKKFELFLKDNKIIIDSLNSVFECIMENSESVKSNQNSVSKIIAIVNTIQNNVFDISLSQHYILAELYHTLLEKQSEDPKDKDRLEKLGNTLRYIQKRLDNNKEIINKYGNGKH